MNLPHIPRLPRRLLLSCLGLLCTVATAEPGSDAPWPTPIPGWQPVQPNEHPRLLFRQADLPELRRRAQTEEGQAILNRLRQTLGGGEAMPEHYSDEAPRRYGDGRNRHHPLGAFTTWHAAGFGFLYVLTEEQKYAELARACLEKSFAGKIDRDPRYGYERTGGEIRVGPMLAAIAYAYDFCYPAWPEDFRQKVAHKILHYETVQATTDKVLTTDFIVRTPRHHPANNHWGSQIGGMGVALLAIRGDNGVDNALVEEYLEIILANARLQVEEGFSPSGWHSEGTHPGRIPLYTGFSEFIQVARTALGLDYTTHSRTVQMMGMRWAYEIFGERGQVRVPHHGDYGDDRLITGSPMLSQGGIFSKGMGMVTPEQRRALLWVYNTFAEHENFPRPYDVGAYPHRAIYAFLNWPIGEEPLNPAEVLPKVIDDTEKGYFLFRNRWQDNDDILVTVILGNASKRGFKHVSGGPTHVWGLGMRTRFSGFRNSALVSFQGYEDGSGVLVTHNGGNHTGMAVDFSRHSGAEAVIVKVGERAGTGTDEVQGPNNASAIIQEIEANGRLYRIMTLQKGPPPELSVKDGWIRVGPQGFRFDGEKMEIEKTADVLDYDAWFSGVGS
ncbi:MAG: hypothetical protein JJU29_18875 [Verrucomicrobia bacterium]|nr:hypothetical protein [Verrucomicrobiota bacterium]MCH8512425.1 hypothetical protein [Kiritimatiellia bacterium]